MVADGVVVGDGEEVQTALDAQAGELGNGELAVGVHGVGVEVPGPPGQPIDRRQLSPRAPLRSRRIRGLRLRLHCGGGTGIHLGDDLVIQPLWRDAMKPEHDVPRSGL